jgi:hypothetical protein
MPSLAENTDSSVEGYVMRDLIFVQIRANQLDRNDRALGR